MVFIIFFICAGAATACGYFALITSIGMINRFAQYTESANKTYLYESMLILGAIVGNLLILYHPHVHIYSYFLVIIMFFAGMFVGSLLISLAEHLKGFPVLIRRFGMVNGLKIIVLAFAIGKMTGSIFYFLCCQF